MYLLYKQLITNGLFALKSSLFIFMLLLSNLKIDAQVIANYSYTGGVQTFVVPCGVSSINVKAWGAGGSGGGIDTYSGAIGGGGAFIGGATRFINPTDSNVVDVVPTVGRFLIFQHNIWHEGEAVESGVKYCLRTEVMFKFQRPEKKKRENSQQQQK